MPKRKRRKRSRYHRGSHQSPKLTNGPAKYRSGWELAYMLWLDAEPTVVSYAYEALKIPYVSNVRTGKTRNYLPDLLVNYVDGTQRLVEIKQARKVMQANVQKKTKAAQIWCGAHGVTLHILTEHELKSLGVL
jgi:hypothetical protein